MPEKILSDNSRLPRPEEVLTCIMAMVINLLIILFSEITKAPVIFSINTGIILLIIIIIYLHRILPSAAFSVFRDWYIIIPAVIIYTEHQHLIPLVNSHDIDTILIQIDRFIFCGNDPTVLFEKLTFPPVTEFMQIVYTSFYFLPFTLCVLLYKKSSKPVFHTVAASIILGFYVSFLGYYLTPAIGPRFTLEHLQTFPLKGVLVFDFLRDTLARIEGVTRDCCPSGHAHISLLTLLLARRYYKPFFPAALVWSVLQVISTVYLRYHYVTDLIAGFILVLPVYLSGLYFYRYYNDQDNTVRPL